MHYLASPRRLKPNTAIYLCLIIAGLLFVSCANDVGGKPPSEMESEIQTPEDSAAATRLAAFQNYQPPMEEEFSESNLISGITIEEVKALFGGEPVKARYSNRFPALKVSSDMLNVEVAPGDMDTWVINVGSEGSGVFEWDYALVDQPEWLSAMRPMDPETGDIDSLSLTFDSTELTLGDYMATLMIIGLPVARDSPKEIPIVFSVREPQAP
ncbi:MAG: hypothetical protein HQ478_05265 [Chloroflexi bacterium]|nr:hypothetical protein [Chloroflexota bacterium]